MASSANLTLSPALQGWTADEEARRGALASEDRRDSDSSNEDGRSSSCRRPDSGRDSSDSDEEDTAANATEVPTQKTASKEHSPGAELPLPPSLSLIPALRLSVIVSLSLDPNQRPSQRLLPVARPR